MCLLTAISFTRAVFSCLLYVLMFRCQLIFFCDLTVGICACGLNGFIGVFGSALFGLMARTASFNLAMCGFTFEHFVTFGMGLNWGTFFICWGCVILFGVNYSAV